MSTTDQAGSEGGALQEIGKEFHQVHIRATAYLKSGGECSAHRRLLKRLVVQPKASARRVQQGKWPLPLAAGAIQGRRSSGRRSSRRRSYGGTPALRSSDSEGLLTQHPALPAWPAAWPERVAMPCSCRKRRFLRGAPLPVCRITSHTLHMPRWPWWLRRSRPSGTSSTGPDFRPARALIPLRHLAGTDGHAALPPLGPPASREQGGGPLRQMMTWLQWGSPAPCRLLAVLGCLSRRREEDLLVVEAST